MFFASASSVRSAGKRNSRDPLKDPAVMLDRMECAVQWRTIHHSRKELLVEYWALAETKSDPEASEDHVSRTTHHRLVLVRLIKSHGQVAPAAIHHKIKVVHLGQGTSRDIRPK